MILVSFKVDDMTTTYWDCIKCAHCCIFNDVSLDELDLWSIFHKPASQVLQSESLITVASSEEDFGFKIGNVIAVPYFFMKKTITSPCPFLTDYRCKIYSQRPIGCSAFPFLLSPEGFQFDSDCGAAANTSTNELTDSTICVSKAMFLDLVHYFLRVSLLDYLIESMHQIGSLAFFSAPPRERCVGILEYLFSVQKGEKNFDTKIDLAVTILNTAVKVMTTFISSESNINKAQIQINSPKIRQKLQEMQESFLTEVREKLQFYF